MYVPQLFAETDIDTLHGLMHAHPLATLVTLADGVLDANHVPLQLDAEAAPLGVLRGHLARANPLWRQHPAAVDVLAIFHGPQAYVSPGWYPTKVESGKAVPTWNYATVHAHGRLRVIDDAAWLRAHVEALTAANEAVFPEPWQVADAPADYIDRMLAAVVGIEITVTRLEGKWKASQNQPPQNRAGVVRGLREADAAAPMADLVARCTGR